MAYNPALLRGNPDAGLYSSSNLWVYGPGDAHATVEGANYFSDAGQRGMKVGDVVIVIEAAAGGTTVHSVTAVQAATQPGFTAPGAATISAGQFA